MLYQQSDLNVGSEMKMQELKKNHRLNADFVGDRGMSFTF
jgi:hypothetical protein